MRPNTTTGWPPPILRWHKLNVLAFRNLLPAWPLWFSLALLLVPSDIWGAFDFPMPTEVIRRSVSTRDTRLPPAMSPADSISSALTLKSNGFKRVVTVDAEERTISIKETFHGLELKTPLTYNLRSFLTIKVLDDLPGSWLKERTELMANMVKGQAGRTGINIDIPVKFPKALSRIIGEGGGLKITGYRRINFSGRSEWTEGDVLTATHRPSKFPSLVMEQKSQFKIEGAIGEKIHVYVDQDTDRLSELENAIHISYKGSEDEIIQEIQAGNTSLSLPQAQFVSFSSKSTGLFGIKTSAKVGPVNLVAIASQDKGAGTRKSFQAGAESKAQQVYDYQYRTGYYYFLDAAYAANYEWYSPSYIHQYDAALAIDSLEVFIDDANASNNAEEGALFASAVIDPDPDEAPAYGDSLRDENYSGYFRRLDLDEYYVNREMGYIVLSSQLRSGSVLAVTYKLKSQDSWVGEYRTAPTDTSLLKLIRTKNPKPGLETWQLEWKNVYYLGSANIPAEGLDIKIYLDKSGEEDDDSQDGVKYVSLMGLDKFNNQNHSTVGADGVFDFFDGTVVNLYRGELIFPSLRPFDTDFTSEIDDTLQTRVPQLYDEPNETIRQQAHKFIIAVETQNRQASYNLGINIIEGSEVVKLNGQALQRNKDYNVIYETGQITFLTDEALDPTANITVDYEYAPFFQPERKTLLGLHADYSFSKDARWGGTVLYRSESMPLDRRIRLGAEPTRAMVWDSDFSLKFEPWLLTNAVDALPLVRTNTPSSLQISGEVAQSLPNSNTQGEAYVDDFDGSKNTTSLSVMRGAWFPASPPITSSPYSLNEAKTGSYSVKSRARTFYWFNPYEQVDVTEIWPNKEAYAREGRTHVLTFYFTPNDSLDRSWAGVMKSLSQGNYDQSRSKYIELWVNGSQGQINIDMGLIPEEVIPNGKLDSEDRGAQEGRGDGLLDIDEDVGLDGIAQTDPNDWWDLNGDSVKDPEEPNSSDDWNYSSGSTDYSRINGTEGNRNDPDRGIQPDTEDLNGNGTLDNDNRFFRFSFSLSKDSPDTMYVAGGDLDQSNWSQSDSWRLYRIPLDMQTEIVSTADMTNIQFVRLWVTGLNTTARVRFATIDIVGNDWLEDGIVADSTSFPIDTVNSKESFSITVKNTHDNPDDYIPPPGVAGVIDPVTKLRQMEQSLVLNVENLMAGHSGSASQIFLGTAKDFTNYQTLLMYVYGDIESSTGVDSGAAEFFFRFGADTSNYYEYRTTIYPGWDSRNEVHINFDDMTSLKYAQVGDSGSRADTTAGHFRVYGKPSLSDIRRLTAGVKALAPGDSVANPSWESVTGEVWIDELRLADARDDAGLAGRINIDAKLADLGALTVRMSKMDAEFQSLGASSQSDATKNAKADNSIQGSLNLNKLFPDKWALSLPATGSYSKTVQQPKLRSGSDVVLNEDQQWDQRTEQITKSGSIRFSKQPSSFWPLNLTLDRMKFSFSGSEKTGQSTTSPQSMSRQLSGTFSYNLSVAKNLSFSPLGWTASKFVPKFISGTKMTLIPSNLTFDTDVGENRSQTEDRHGAVTAKFSRTTSQKLSTTLKPFGSVSTTFSFDRKFDSQNADIASLHFGRETDRSQSLSLSYKLPFLLWLGPSYSYRVNYREKENSKIQLDDGGFGRDADNSLNHSVNASLNPSQFLLSLGAPKKGDKVGTLSPRRILGTLRMMTDRFQSISGTYQKDERSSWLNLMGRPSLQYQFGTDDSTGVASDTTLSGQPMTSSSGQSWSAKSGINLFGGINVGTGIASDFKSNITSTGQTESWTLTFPQVNTRWDGLGKLFLIKNLVKSSNVDFNYTEKKTKDGTGGNWKGDFGQPYSESVSRNFSPLFSWTATWAKSLSSTVSSNRSYTENTNYRQSGTVTTQTTSSLQASVKYSFSAPKGIKFPGLGLLKFQSNMNLNLDFKRNDAKNETMGVPNPITKWDQTQSIALGGDYAFSKKVKGGLKIEFSDRNDKKTDRKTTVRDVGVWTEIRFD